jgi:Ca-activated chloride channel family protein
MASASIASRIACLSPSTKEIRMMRRWLCCAALVAVSPLQAEEQAILVLDASGSMWGQIDGRAKIEIAREAVGGMLAAWPASHQLGLIAYGHRRKGDCADIEALLPPGPLDAAAFQGRVDGLVPKGMTPITASVRAAAEALRFSEQRATVILVSDGEETCNADPCALGAELERLGVDFTAHVIGFDLPEGPARAQLQCLAEGTGGRYIEARDAAGLGDALGEIAAEPTPPPPAVQGGQPWVPGYSLDWVAGEQLEGEDGGGTRVIEFTVEQTARDCQAQCEADAACGGWHYEPTGSFFIDYPRCHLKGKTAPLRLVEQGEGWVAGVKDGVKLLRAEE